MKIRFLIVVMVLMSSLMPGVSVLGQYVREGSEIVLGDLEGPDFVQPPSHYKTLEMMLAQAGITESPLGPPPVPVHACNHVTAHI